MTLRLILMRHAKSCWATAGQADHERPLNARGRDGAAAIGRWLAARGERPDLALCSDATRTAETLEAVLAQLPERPRVMLSPKLYHVAPAAMLEALKTADAATVLMVGHNPGIAAFAAGILGFPPDHGRFADYPTAATLVAEFDAPGWAGVAPGTARALAFVTPHDL